MFGGAYSGTY
jgi:hypothetical protein